MSSNAPAQTRDRAAPYSQTFTTAQADLTSKVVSAAAAGAPQVAPYQNACDAMLVMPLTAAACALTYRDCAGTANVLAWTAPASSVGVPFLIPGAAIGLDLVTNVSVTCFWHGTNGPGR